MYLIVIENEMCYILVHISLTFIHKGPIKSLLIIKTTLPYLIAKLFLSLHFRTDIIVISKISYLHCIWIWTTRILHKHVIGDPGISYLTKSRFYSGKTWLSVYWHGNTPEWCYYSISQEICTRFLLFCALLWLCIDWFSHIHQAYFTGTVAI